MVISKWLVVLMCAGSAFASSALTVAIQNCECAASMDLKNSDSAFKTQPTIRGGSKEY